MDILEHLKGEIAKDIEQLKEACIAGAPKNHEQYTELVGRANGLERALMHIRDIERNMIREENGDE